MSASPSFLSGLLYTVFSPHSDFFFMPSPTPTNNQGTAPFIAHVKKVLGMYSHVLTFQHEMGAQKGRIGEPLCSSVLSKKFALAKEDMRQSQ
jgi:hypothetical protein